MAYLNFGIFIFSTADKLQLCYTDHSSVVLAVPCVRRMQMLTFFYIYYIFYVSFILYYGYN